MNESDIDIIYLYYNLANIKTDSYHDLDLGVILYKAYPTWGTVGYIITEKGAKKLLYSFMVIKECSFNFLSYVLFLFLRLPLIQKFTFCLLDLGWLF